MGAEFFSCFANYTSPPAKHILLCNLCFLTGNTSCIYHIRWHKYFHGYHFSIDTIQRLGRWKDCRVTFLFYGTRVWHWSVPTSLSHSTRFKTRGSIKLNLIFLLPFKEILFELNRISSSYLFCNRFNTIFYAENI